VKGLQTAPPSPEALRCAEQLVYRANVAGVVILAEPLVDGRVRLHVRMRTDGPLPTAIRSAIEGSRRALAHYLMHGRQLSPAELAERAQDPAVCMQVGEGT
jgi:hypothetical protein